MSFEESGPDEDHQVQWALTSEIFTGTAAEDCSSSLPWAREGVYEIHRTDEAIKCFVNHVPTLQRYGQTYGLIWDKSLCPVNGQYSEGCQYFKSGDSDIKSAHSIVSFYCDMKTSTKFTLKTLITKLHPEEIFSRLTTQHPHICDVYGIIVKHGQVHILMEYAGSSLVYERAWIAESKDRFFSMAKQGFEALNFVHKNGYVLCDVKPENMAIKRNGNDFVFKLIDFGTCQQENRTLPSNAHTTKEYWAPEIWKALSTKCEVLCHPSIDVYAMALSFYFVQKGEHVMHKFNAPDIGPVMTVMPDHIKAIALPDDIPQELRAVMESCFEVNPAKRPTAETSLNRIEEDISANQQAAKHVKSANQQALKNVKPTRYIDTLRKLASSSSIPGSRSQKVCSGVDPQLDAPVLKPTPSSVVYATLPDDSHLKTQVQNDKKSSKGKTPVRGSVKAVSKSLSKNPLKRQASDKKNMLVSYHVDDTAYKNVTKVPDAGLAAPTGIYPCSELLLNLALKSSAKKEKSSVNRSDDVEPSCGSASLTISTCISPHPLDSSLPGAKSGSNDSVPNSALKLQLPVNNTPCKPIAAKKTKSKTKRDGNKKRLSKGMKRNTLDKPEMARPSETEGQARRQKNTDEGLLEGEEDNIDWVVNVLENKTFEDNAIVDHLFNMLDDEEMVSVNDSGQDMGEKNMQHGGDTIDREAESIDVSETMDVSEPDGAHGAACKEKCHPVVPTSDIAAVPVASTKNWSPYYRATIVQPSEMDVDLEESPCLPNFDLI